MADQHHQLFSSSDAVTVSVTVTERDSGLPSDDLTPLSTLLLPPSLAAAFSVASEPSKTVLDVHLATLETLAPLRSHHTPPAAKLPEASSNEQEALEGSSSRSLRRRLVWTPQLHKQFLDDVMARLGLKETVPKKIMGMMNVEGLTREHVDSHLQKYQMKLKESSPCNCQLESWQLKILR